MSKKGAYISTAMQRGATNQQARSAWERSEKDDYHPMTPSSKTNSNNQKEYDFDSDINGNGTNWHTSEDL